MVCGFWLVVLWVCLFWFLVFGFQFAIRVDVCVRARVVCCAVLYNATGLVDYVTDSYGHAVFAQGIGEFF